MPSLEGPDVKNEGKSERLKGEKGEERGEWKKECRIPLSSTVSGHSNPHTGFVMQLCDQKEPISRFSSTVSSRLIDGHLAIRLRSLGMDLNVVL